MIVFLSLILLSVVNPVQSPSTHKFWPSTNYNQLAGGIENM